MVVEIADTGAGLTAEECERLFTPYYTSKAHGTGLGLAIVQSIISDHGRQDQRAQPAGTRNNVYDRAAGEFRQTDRGEPRMQFGSILGAAVPQKAHLLIVDDEANTLASLSRAFRLAGHEAAVCDNAAKALELARSQPFDLILSDVVMPGKDGLSLLEELKAQGVSTPVVMMSGQAHIDMAVRATRLGALDFLEKPISTEKLLLTVENALKLQRLESENRQLRQRLGKHEIVWTGDTMKKLMAQVERVAASETRVCILGETGHRQGIGRAHAARAQPASFGTIRHLELRRGSGRTDRVRTVWSRERLVHRRRRAPHRQIRAGRARERSFSTKSATCL